MRDTVASVFWDDWDGWDPWDDWVELSHFPEQAFFGSGPWPLWSKMPSVPNKTEDEVSAIVRLTIHLPPFTAIFPARPLS